MLVEYVMRLDAMSQRVKDAEGRAATVPLPPLSPEEEDSTNYTECSDNDEAYQVVEDL